MAASVRQLAVLSAPRALLNLRNSFNIRNIGIGSQLSPWQSAAGGPLHATFPPGLACSRWLHSKLPEDGRLKTAQSEWTQSFSTSPAAQYIDDENNDSLEVVEAVNSQLQSPDHGRLFAVVHIDDHQRKVTTEDIIVIERHLEADVGDKIRLNKVLLLGGSDFTLVGRPVLSSKLVKVEATVIEKTLSHDQIHFWYIRRKRHRKMKVDRVMQTLLRISSIEVTPLNGSQS